MVAMAVRKVGLKMFQAEVQVLLTGGVISNGLYWRAMVKREYLLQAYRPAHCPSKRSLV